MENEGRRYYELWYRYLKHNKEYTQFVEYMRHKKEPGLMSGGIRINEIV